VVLLLQKVAATNERIPNLNILANLFVNVIVDGHALHHWLACGFASYRKGFPVSIPFPALFNNAGSTVLGISQCTHFGQLFHWQNFEGLVPNII
jgi:hypothetical protein